MGTIELLLIAVGLAMDAFAVSVCKGLAAEEFRPRDMLAVGLWFGGFQVLMPLLGYLLGSAFEVYVAAVDHWVAFILLTIIGITMIRDALSKKEEPMNASFAVKAMLPLAIATSIDALAVGITFALLPDVSLFRALLLIGVITFLLSAAGLKIGNVFGAKYKSRAEFAGGVILILIGLKILLEHLGILKF